MYIIICHVPIQCLGIQNAIKILFIFCKKLRPSNAAEGAFYLYGQRCIVTIPRNIPIDTNLYTYI